LDKYGLGDAVEKGGLVACVPVKDHRVAAEGSGETAHRQPVDPIEVDVLEVAARQLRDALAGAIGSYPQRYIIDQQAMDEIRAQRDEARAKPARSSPSCPRPRASSSLVARSGNALVSTGGELLMVASSCQYGTSMAHWR
jgi:hypothetical protein